VIADLANMGVHQTNQSTSYILDRYVITSDAKPITDDIADVNKWQ